MVPVAEAALMAVAVKASAEVELVERLCRSLGIDPDGVDEITVSFKVGEMPMVRLTRWADRDASMRLVTGFERYNLVTVERR